MLNLIIKDILMQKKRMVFGLAYILIACVSFQSMEVFVYPMAMTGFAYMLVFTSCAYEDMNKADVMVNSLPVSRKMVVAAKYLSVIFYFMIGTLVYALLIAFNSIPGFPVTIQPITLQSFAAGFASVSLIIAFVLPVFYKVGYMKSRITVFILFFIFFFGISAISEIITKSNYNIYLSSLIVRIDEIGSPAVSILIFAALVILLAISYLIAVKFYKNREF